MIATPWGPNAVPTGGAGVAWPAGIWILTTASTLFLAMTAFSLLQLRDLAEFQLDRRLAAENVDEHLELELVLVDLDDLAREVRERPLAHPDRLAPLVLQAGAAALRCLFVARLHLEERLDVPAGQ